MAEDINEIIKDQVDAKVSELSTWKKVRWEGGRLYYESARIINEISDYDTSIQLLYLECLLNKQFVIQDNWPNSAPDITADFKNWIKKTITNLKLKQSQEEERKPYSKKRRGRSIPYKIKALLIKEVSSRCPFCPNEDVGHFQIHHIDEDSENNGFENLIMVCPNCHSKITKRDILQSTVLSRKSELAASKYK